MLHLFFNPVCKSFLYNKLDCENRRYNCGEAKYVSHVKYSFLRIPEEDAKYTEHIFFESLSVSCCRNIKSYLESHFWFDYMSLPSLEKRVNHRPVILKL